MGKLSSLLRAAGHGKRFNSAVILAAGSGKRFSDDTAKQFVEIAGESILVRSAKAFEMSGEVDEIVVVTRETDVIGCRNLLEKAGVTKATRVIGGGETRQASAKRGFDAVNPAADYVAIHDAARCLVTPEMIEAVFEAAYVTGAAAAASRNPDTIKRTDGSDRFGSNNRYGVFPAGIYGAAAYMAERDAVTATDDCALCERLGFPVRLVDCGPTNIKITYPADVVIAEAILKSREAGK